MTSASAAPAPARTPRHTPADARVTFPRLVRSQWMALRSLRSSLVSLIVGMIATIGLAAAFAFLMAYSSEQAGGLFPLPDLTTMGNNTAIIAMCVAVLVAVAHYAKEHATGALATTRAAAPKPVGLIGAKATVVGLASFAAGVITLALSFAAVAVVYGSFGYATVTGSFLDTVVLPILGGALYIAACAVFGLGVAVPLRSETWAVLVVLLFLLMVPTVLANLPYDWAPATADVLLGTTGQTLMLPFPGLTGTYALDLALTVAWPAAAVVAAMAVERSRDA